MTGSLLHNVPFPGSGRTWHQKMIFHRFLVLYCCCLYFHTGQNSTPRVLCVLVVVVLASCSVIMCHWRRLEYLVSCPYPGGKCYSSRTKFLSITHNHLAWVRTSLESYECVLVIIAPPAYIFFSSTCVMNIHFARSDVDISASILWW